MCKYFGICPRIGEIPPKNKAVSRIASAIVKSACCYINLNKVNVCVNLILNNVFYVSQIKNVCFPALDKQSADCEHKMFYFFILPVLSTNFLLKKK